MAEAVSSQLLTADTWFCAQVSPCGVNKMALGQAFLQVLQFFPVSIISLLHHIYSYISCGMDGVPIRGPATHGPGLTMLQQ
jgi:hypothetical protein